MDILQLRRTERARLLNEIKIQESALKICNESLTKLKKNNKDDEYSKKQILKITESITKSNLSLTELNGRYNSVEEGLCDTELKDKVQRNKKEIVEKTKITMDKKRQKLEEKKEDAKISKDYYNKERKGDRVNKHWFYNSAFRHYEKTYERLPDWLLNDLKKWPCNKGYIWKNIYFYGSRSPRGNADSYEMIEICKGYKYIHRWDKKFSRIYKKTKGDRTEVLYKEELRKLKT